MSNSKVEARHREVGYKALQLSYMMDNTLEKKNDVPRYVETINMRWQELNKNEVIRRIEV
jgi:hypothetical protein